MVKRCAACDFNNRDEAAFCPWCGSFTGSVPIVAAVSRKERVWLPSYVYEFDPEFGYTPAIEWQQYEME